MDPVTLVATLNAALTLSNELLPIVAQYRAEGKITAEQQAALRAKYESLLNRANGEFSGPHWKPSNQG
jgi:hypothetical protein